MSSISLQPLYNQAVSCHQNGSFAEAERLYLQVLGAESAHFGASHMLGILRAQQQRMPEALTLIGNALKAKPDAVEALLDYGNVLRALGRPQDALASYERALTLQPRYAAALSNRGDVLRLLNRSAEALTSFDMALAVNPNQVDALNNRGIVLCEQSRFEEALADFDKAIASRSNHVSALNNRGFALRKLGRLEEALADYDRVLVLDPNHAEALNNRAIVLRDLNRLSEALAASAKALSLKPDYAEALDNRGLILSDLHRPAEALASHDKALAAKPDYAPALYNRSNCLRDLRRFPEALDSLDRYLAAKPGSAEAWNNRGMVLSELGRAVEALASYEIALSVRPSYGRAFYNRGVALWGLKRFEEALVSYEDALAASPPYAKALGGLAHAALHLCDWARVAEITPLVQASVTRAEGAILPFVFLGYSGESVLQSQCASAYIKSRFAISPPPLSPPLSSGTAYAHDKLRIAYMSSDFRRHPMTACITELFELHDRSRFEIFGISLGPDDGSEIRARLMRAVDRFIDVRSLPSAEVAALLRELEVDILVDLNGHTEGARTDILPHRPAPVQVSYMGYPGTMGADFIDYVVADETVLPLDRQPFYAEKILHLPDSYWVNDSKRAIAPIPSRRDAGLPDQGFVFCCFNNNWKIAAPVFDIWMRLLAAVPGSVLWLLQSNDVARASLCRQAEARGIAATRLIFAPIVDPADHLGRHGLADLILDTLPYDAHTTACDALLTGVPIVTCKGEAFAGRVAASLLKAVGLPELITQTPQDYETLALGLARDPERLQRLRLSLAQNRAACALFDTDRFRRNIEALYSGIAAKT